MFIRQDGDYNDDDDDGGSLGGLPVNVEEGDEQRAESDDHEQQQQQGEGEGEDDVTRHTRKKRKRSRNRGKGRGSSSSSNVGDDSDDDDQEDAEEYHDEDDDEEEYDEDDDGEDGEEDVFVDNGDDMSDGGRKKKRRRRRSAVTAAAAVRRDPERKTIGDYILDTLSGEPMQQRNDDEEGGGGGGHADDSGRRRRRDDDDDGGVVAADDEWQSIEEGGGGEEEGWHGATMDGGDDYDDGGAGGGGDGLGLQLPGMDAGGGMPQLRIVDGQIVIGDATLTVPEPEPVDWNRFERVVETEGTRHITSNTFARHKKGDKWTDEDISMFYRGLRQFGSDFTMISRLFPKRSRREIRNRFKKEERENRDRIEWALTNRLPIDFEEFKRLSDEKDRLEGTVEKDDSDDELHVEPMETDAAAMDVPLTAATEIEETDFDDEEWESTALHSAALEEDDTLNAGEELMTTQPSSEATEDGFERIDETENEFVEDNTDDPNLQDALAYITRYGV